jgi:hypothetical protein
MLQDRAMLLKVTPHRPSNRLTDRTMSMVAAGVFGMASDRSSATRRLWKGSVYDKIVSHDGETDRMVEHISRPWLDRGWRIIPTAAFFDKLIDMLGTRKGQREMLVDEFINTLDRTKEVDRAALGERFDENDYNADILRPKFALDVTFMPIPREGDFRAEGVDAEDIARIEQETLTKIHKQFESRDLWDRIRAELMPQGVPVSDRLRSYSSDPISGKVMGIFRDSLIENIRALVEVLPALNIAADPEIDAVANDLKEVVEYDADVLRASDAAREDVAAKVDKILADVARLSA